MQNNEETENMQEILTNMIVGAILHTWSESFRKFRTLAFDLSSRSSEAGCDFIFEISGNGSEQTMCDVTYR